MLVTADHGFLYQDAPPGALEKSDLGSKPGGVVKAKKRYVLGHDLGESSNTWHGYTSTTAGTQDDMEFWIPKGVNRFHFSGGAKFIHGGALPQEVVVPILQVKELDSKAAEKEAVKKVGVSLLGSNRRLMNTICKFEFIQTEKVPDRMLPRTLVISIRDGDVLVSSEETVTFDSESDSMNEPPFLAFTRSWYVQLDLLKHAPSFSHPWPSARSGTLCPLGSRNLVIVTKIN